MFGPVVELAERHKVVEVVLAAVFAVAVHGHDVVDVQVVVGAATLAAVAVAFEGRVAGVRPHVLGSPGPAAHESRLATHATSMPPVIPRETLLFHSRQVDSARRHSPCHSRQSNDAAHALLCADISATSPSSPARRTSTPARARADACQTLNSPPFMWTRS